MGFFYGAAWAVQVNPVGVYWDLQASYGSGSGVGDGVIVSNSTQWLTPSIPHEYLISSNGSLWVDTGWGNQYAYADYSVNETSLDAAVYGFAQDVSTNTDWYYALSKVAIASNPFGGQPQFVLTFDWNIDFEFDTAYNWRAGYAVGLIDWTETTDPYDPVFVHQETVFFTDNASGHYENSWNIDPTHEYIFGVGILAEISGVEDAEGDVYIEITNLNAQAVPEPASMLLVGAGLGALALFGRRKKA